MKIAINGEILEVSGGGALPAGTVAVKPLTQAEYDALTDEEKQADVVYAITDDGGSGSSSGDSSEEIYSTEEVRIGTWIDGKPLYRRVVTGVVTTLNTDLDVGDPIPDIETVASVVGTFTNGGGYWYPHQTFVNDSSSITAFISAKVSQGRIQVRTSFSLLVNQKCYITVEYTKTTDTAPTQEVTQ